MLIAYILNCTLLTKVQFSWYLELINENIDTFILMDESPLLFGMIKSSCQNFVSVFSWPPARLNLQQNRGGHVKNQSSLTPKNPKCDQGVMLCTSSRHEAIIWYSRWWQRRVEKSMDGKKDPPPPSFFTLIQILLWAYNGEQQEMLTSDTTFPYWIWSFLRVDIV